MKRICLLLLVPLFFVQCSKEDEPLFIIPVNNLTFTAQTTWNDFETHYVPANDGNNILTRALELLAEHDLEPADINSIRPRIARMTVPFSDGKLDFIEAVSIRLCSLGDNQENCGREAFWRDPVPEGTNFSLGLNGSDIDDISDILLENKINIQIKLERLRWRPTGVFNVRVDLEFGVY